MTSGKKDDGLATAQVRAAYLLTGLIGLQVIFGVLTQSAIDVAVLGLLAGLLTAVLGITTLTGVAKAIRKDDTNEPPG